MHTKLNALAGGALLLSAAVAVPVAADDDMAEMRAVSAAVGLISPEQATERALAAKAGTVVDVDLDRKRGQHYYEIEIIDAQGMEWEIDIDAKSGEIRRTKRDWDLF
jgi:uncharacterized membrane protein YkoI